MTYLYNAYAALADLAQRLQDLDENERLEQLDEIIDQTWRPVPDDLLSEIDWPELDDVVALAERRIPEHATLLHGLLVDPPLEIPRTVSAGRGRAAARIGELWWLLWPIRCTLLRWIWSPCATTGTFARWPSRSHRIYTSSTSTSPSATSPRSTM